MAVRWGGLTKEAWLQRRREDAFWRMAKERGLPSRAAFKLEEIQSRWRIIRKGGRVLDLGAAPGGMTAVASRLVDEQGLVVAVDKDPIQFVAGNVIFVRGDVFESVVLREISKYGPYDCIVSDLSPHHSGDYDLLVEQQLELLRQARLIALQHLKKGGTLLLKAFEHPSLRKFERETSRHFSKFERYVPKSSKRGSSEIFLLFLGLTRRAVKARQPVHQSLQPLGQSV
jgi:23S rRNA (uridine2552-2'-O)-methyltransferase